MADKRVVIPEDLGTSFELKNKKWGIKLGNGLAPNAQGAISLDPDTIGEAIADAISNSPGTGMGLNSDGKLSVLRSPDAGNLLEVRENGIYYGVVAQQENWYIDSFSGNDDNKGTKNAPLKTLYGLHKKIPNGTYSYNIYLKEGGTYPVKNTETNEFQTLLNHLTNVTKITFRTYGDVYDNVINTPENVAANAGLFQPFIVKSYNRPIIQFGEYVYTYPNGINSIRGGALLTTSVQSVVFSGVKLEIVANTYPDSYDYISSGRVQGSSIEFVGCIFSFPQMPSAKKQYSFVRNASSVSYMSCAVENPNNNISPYNLSSTTLMALYVNDYSTRDYFIGSDGTTRYETIKSTTDFIPYLNQNIDGTVYNRFYAGLRTNYIINRDDV